MFLLKLLLKLGMLVHRSSRFGRLQSIQCAIAGKNLYMRFRCSTGDAMGMNMVSKGVQNVLDFLQTDFPDMDVIGISGTHFFFFFLFFSLMQRGIYLVKNNNNDNVIL